MRKIYILLGFLLTFLCSGCSNWLTVEPKTEVSEEKMFSTDLGFTNALVGLYLQLEDIYTPESFMMGGEGVDVMANNYVESTYTSGTSYLLYNHNYDDTNVDSELGSLFQAYYKVIANADVLIDALQSQTILSTDKANLIKGEALGIRAFCHFELLRLWGPCPTQVNASKKYLPYVKELSTENYEYINYQSYVKNLFTDFNQADSLLATSDPIMKYSNSKLNSSWTSISEYTDLFWYYRQKRLNYYGVEGLLARLYLWTGDDTNAYKYAKDCVEATNTDGTSKFTMGAQSNISLSDYPFFSEHLFGVYIDDWYDKYGYFSGSNATYCNTVNTITNKLYDDQTDLRLNLFKQSYSYSYGYVYGTLKFSYMQSSDYGDNSIPLVRLSEMYLILAEAAPTLDDANNWYKQFRTARDASYTPLTEANRTSSILKEYVREFYSEGQSFFAFKRLDYPTLTMSGASMNACDYILPIPTAETGFYK